VVHPVQWLVRNNPHLLPLHRLHMGLPHLDHATKLNWMDTQPMEGKSQARPKRNGQPALALLHIAALECFVTLPG
jgi:hypothetical protein